MIRRAPVNGVSSSGIGAAHAAELERLLAALHTTIELDERSGYGDRLHGRHPNRRSFLAHFADLQEPLSHWDERAERAQVAPAALHQWFASSAPAQRIAEPPFLIAALIDCLTEVTVERARSGQLHVPRVLHFEHLTARFRHGEQVSVYLEGDKVARVPLEPQVSLSRRLDAVTAQVQGLFDEGQLSGEAAELVASRDSLLELKQPLLDRLALHGSPHTIAFAAGCPICRRERGQSLRANA